MSSKPMQTERLSAGRQYDCSNDLKCLINSAADDGYDFISAHVAHPWCCYQKDQLPDRLPPITRPDLILRSKEWNRLVVATVSSWIDVDSSDDHLRILSEQALREELSYYAYLNLPAILLEIKRPRQPNLAKIINDYAEQSGGPVVWVVVPTAAQSNDCVPNGLETKESVKSSSMTNGYDGDKICGSVSSLDLDDTENELADPWYWFHNLRTACDNKQRLGLVLRLTADIPSSETKLKRWLGEPLKAFLADTSLFLTNDKRYPVLSKTQQTYVKELFSLKVQVIVTGRSLHVRPTYQDPDQTTDTVPVHKSCLYYTYLNHLFKNRPCLDIVSEWAIGYEDFLQIPLQPLGDNLESQIYETFERDPIKYAEYKKAVADAISFVKSKKPSRQNNLMIIMVLGAGRGPLVSATVEALETLNAHARVFAVEKNPNAVITLNYLARTKWKDSVTVIHSDMRDFRPDEKDKADIVVSELLGSFGDNELSPECLDGALHLLKPDCISIPKSYTSYLAPIHSPKLYQTVKQQASRMHQTTTAFETNYVVRIHNYFLPSVPQPLYAFDHPNYKLASNDRYKELTFVASESCDVAGLVGFFHAELYAGITLSIVPAHHTPGLFSWFPIFFPFKDPIHVKKGEEIVINFWRSSNPRQVWYEWSMSKPVQTAIMNCEGRSSNMRKI